MQILNLFYYFKAVKNNICNILDWDVRTEKNFNIYKNEGIVAESTFPLCILAYWVLFMEIQSLYLHVCIQDQCMWVFFFVPFKCVLKTAQCLLKRKIRNIFYVSLEFWSTLQIHAHILQYINFQLMSMFSLHYMSKFYLNSSIFT